MKRSRNGKYQLYEMKILHILSIQKQDISAKKIMKKAKIPKSSLYDVLRKLSDLGYISWIGESQDWVSIVLITSKGKNYLKRITNLYL